jgi:hypothetical protein
MEEHIARMEEKAVRLVVGFLPLRPGFAPGQSMWDLWWTKWHWSRFSPSTLVSLANHHFTNFSIITNTRGRHNRPTGGRSVEWTQLDSTPHYTNVKKKKDGRGWTIKTIIRYQPKGKRL